MAKRSHKHLPNRSYRFPDGPWLTLDPSSSATGWAIFDGRGGVKSFGVLRPIRSASPIARIDQMVRKAVHLCMDHKPVLVVLELASGRVHRSHKGGGSGLTMLGAAQGAMRQAVRDLGFPVEVVSELEWTGRIDKEVRAGRIRMEFPEYRAFAKAGHDNGFDAADAIGLGLWYHRLAQLDSLSQRKG